VYTGKCGNDGFYYNDYNSFVICSNGNAHIQPCAPGSKNSANSNYNYGSSYNYRDFCDVNLVDDGYTLKHGSYNTGYHGNRAATYGHNAGYGVNSGYGADTGYGRDAGYGANTGYGINSDYGIDAGYGVNAGYGINSGYGIDAGYGVNSAYGYNAPVKGAGYGSNNFGYSGQNGYAGYNNNRHVGSYQRTEYKTYGAESKAH
jgi:hypothetical protein